MDHFLGRFNQRFGQAKRMTDAALQLLLLRHHWPGNVRELHNVVQRAVVLSRGDMWPWAFLASNIDLPGCCCSQRLYSSAISTWDA